MHRFLFQIEGLPSAHHMTLGQSQNSDAHFREVKNILTLQVWGEFCSSRFRFPTSQCGVYGQRCVRWGGEQEDVGSTSIHVRRWWGQQETHLRST